MEERDINKCKILLANKTTELLHGKEESMKSEKIAKEIFSENSLGSNLQSKKLHKSLLQNDMNIIDLVIFSKFEKSRSEVRRLIKGKAIKINNKIIEDEKFKISENIFVEKYIKLSIGKKRHIKIELI